MPSIHTVQNLNYVIVQWVGIETNTYTHIYAHARTHTHTHSQSYHKHFPAVLSKLTQNGLELF